MVVMKILKSSKTRFLRHKKCIFLLSILLLCAWMVVLKKHVPEIRSSKPLSKIPSLMWWSYIDRRQKIQCGIYTCQLDYGNFSNADAILFYASTISITELPIPRLPTQIWALFHEESPRNVPLIRHEIVLQHFNLTSTFSRFSDLPLTTIYLNDIHQITSPTYLVPVGEKSRLQRSEKLAPIIFIHSDCFTSSGREQYVEELMKYIEVDSYGSCLHNRRLQENLTTDYLHKLENPEFLSLIARYKFLIAFENGVCFDYITEKFWRAFQLGVIPIYFGSPTIREFEPNNKSVIYVEDFASPRELADFIKAINANDTEYNTYLKHKYDQLNPVENEMLKDIVAKRTYNYVTIMDDFECMVCQHVYEMDKTKPKMANTNHYNCPLSILPKLDNIENSGNIEKWLHIMSNGLCEAIALDKMLRINKNFTAENFRQLSVQQKSNGECPGVSLYT